MKQVESNWAGLRSVKEIKVWAACLRCQHVYQTTHTRTQTYSSNLKHQFSNYRTSADANANDRLLNIAIWKYTLGILQRVSETERQTVCWRWLDEGFCLFLLGSNLFIPTSQHDLIACVLIVEVCLMCLNGLFDLYEIHHIKSEHLYTHRHPLPPPSHSLSQSRLCSCFCIWLHY